MFKRFSIQEQMLSGLKRIEILRSKQDKAELVNSITFVKLSENGMIDDVTASEHLEMFAKWDSNISYEKGDLREYKKCLYRCIQPHTSQEDWTPDASASLWSKVGDPTEEYPQWSQPIGAHDAYEKGDKVSFNDRKWISSIDSNIWEPGIYGWEEQAKQQEEENG